MENAMLKKFFQSDNNTRFPPTISIRSVKYTANYPFLIYIPMF